MILIYVLHATCDMSETNGRQFIALSVDLKITDELDKLYNLLEHEGDYRNAIPVERDQVSFEHNHLESSVNDHGDDCACCKH